MKGGVDNDVEKSGDKIEETRCGLELILMLSTSEGCTLFHLRACNVVI